MSNGMLGKQTVLEKLIEQTAIFLEALFSNSGIFEKFPHQESVFSNNCNLRKIFAREGSREIVRMEMILHDQCSHLYNLASREVICLANCRLRMLHSHEVAFWEAGFLESDLPGKTLWEAGLLGSYSFKKLGYFAENFLKLIY